MARQFHDKTMIELNGIKDFVEDINNASKNGLLLQNYKKAKERVRLGTLIKVEDILQRGGCHGPEHFLAFKSLLTNCVYPPICLTLSNEYKLIAPITSIDETYYASHLHSELIVAAVAFSSVTSHAVADSHKSDHITSKVALDFHQKKLINSLFDQLTIQKMVRRREDIMFVFDVNKVALAWLIRSYYVGDYTPLTAYLDRKLTNNTLQKIYHYTAKYLDGTLNTKLINEEQELFVQWHTKTGGSAY